MNNLRRSNSTTQVNQRVNSTHRYQPQPTAVSVLLSISACAGAGASHKHSLSSDLHLRGPDLASES